MAMTNKSWQDHFTASFGQESETAQASKDGLTVGGVYNATPPTIADGEFSRFQTDASGNLMVNLASGEAVNITVGTLNTLGTVGVVNAIAAGTQNTLGTVGSVLGIGGTTTTEVVNSIQEFKGTITIAASDTVTTGTLAAPANGLLRHITLITPDMEGTDSTQLFLYDADSAAIYASGTKAESSTLALGTLQLPMTTTMNFVGSAEGTQSASRDVVIGIYYQR